MTIRPPSTHQRLGGPSEDRPPDRFVMIRLPWALATVADLQRPAVDERDDEFAPARLMPERRAA